MFELIVVIICPYLLSLPFEYITHVVDVVRKTTKLLLSLLDKIQLFFGLNTLVMRNL